MRGSKSLPPVQPICILLAAGRGPSLHEVTGEECKAAIAFGAGRLVDFTMSNAFNTVPRQILVARQYLPQNLAQYLDRIWRPSLDTDWLADALDQRGMDRYFAANGGRLCRTGSPSGGDLQRLVRLARRRHLA